MSEPLLHGKVVVVVGAASGIGQACAVAAAADGAQVVLADIREPAEAAVSVPGDPPLTVRADVTSEEDWTRLVGAATELHGRIDGVVLSAGVAQHVPLLEMTRAQWEAMLTLHLTGAFLGIQAAARTMRGTGGSVVYVASTAAAGLGPLHQAHYAAAKAGAIGLVRAAARELGPSGVRVNAVSPGFTLTPLNTGLFSEEDIAERARQAPLRRVAEASDVADTVTFLLSERSRLTTGQTLQVNAGSYMT